ncbi:MAG: glycosyltransferase family 4 protein [Alphaproteobacteria bacterium]
MSSGARGEAAKPTPPPKGPIVFILKGYPRLSETFIAQEILGLERLGFDIRIVSLRAPTDRQTHPVTREINASVLYLPEYLHQAPGRLLAAWRRVRRLPGYQSAKATWRADLRRDFSRNRIRRFGQAMVLAAELPPGVRRLHAHFLHTPASVARYASLITGLPWSCSAHAKDVWTTPQWEVAEKLAGLEALATCTRAGHDYLAGLADRPAKVKLIYHGLDFARFPPPGRPRPRRDGSDADDPVILLSVGRIVAKKGYDGLIAALGRLDPALHWRLVHIGGGDTRALSRQAEALGIAARIDWLGAQAQEVVLDRLRGADLFVLPCRITEDGDRDGLPNVLMEAQSQALACLSTTVSGVPELIEDGRTGLLVAPDDTEALTTALAELIAGPTLREKLGRGGLARVHRHFGQEPGLRALAGLFGEGAGQARAASAAAGGGAAKP